MTVEGWKTPGQKKHNICHIESAGTIWRLNLLLLSCPVQAGADLILKW